MRVISLLIAVCFLAACRTEPQDGPNNQPGRLMIIGLDGTRSDVIEIAHTPALDSLRAEGYTELDAVTGDLSLSGPGWASMLTGVWCDKHNVVDNDASWENSQFDAFPHFITRVEQQRPELQTVSVSHWAPINDEILCAFERFDNCGRADIVINTTTDAGVRDYVVDILSREDPDVVFMQFDDIDHVGHGTAPASQPTLGGFCPYEVGTLDGGCLVPNSEYVEIVEKTDAYIADILEALRMRPNYAQENWLIIVSPDHGGGGTVQNQHGFDNAQDRRTFLIVSGDSAAPLPFPAATSLAELPDPVLPGPGLPLPGLTPVETSGAKIVDIAATALLHLNIPIKDEWRLAGQPVGVKGAPPYRESTIPSCFSPSSFTPDTGYDKESGRGLPNFSTWLDL